MSVSRLTWWALRLTAENFASLEISVDLDGVCDARVAVDHVDLTQGARELRGKLTIALLCLKALEFFVAAVAHGDHNRISDGCAAFLLKP